jgi:hypothetical protein
MCKPMPNRRPWHPRLPHPVRGRGEPIADRVSRTRGIADVSELSYITIDEISEGIVTLLVSPWPEIDEHGRLRFAGSEPRSVDVDQGELTRHLATRHPVHLRRRVLREGDAFAAPLTRRPGRRQKVSAWLGQPVFDITADARDAAKAATRRAARRQVAGSGPGRAGGGR